MSGWICKGRTRIPGIDYQRLERMGIPTCVHRGRVFITRDVPIPEGQRDNWRGLLPENYTDECPPADRYIGGAIGTSPKRQRVYSDSNTKMPMKNEIDKASATQ